MKGTLNEIELHSPKPGVGGGVVTLLPGVVGLTSAKSVNCSGGAVHTQLGI